MVEGCKWHKYSSITTPSGLRASISSKLLEVKKKIQARRLDQPTTLRRWITIPAYHWHVLAFIMQAFNKFPIQFLERLAQKFIIRLFYMYTCHKTILAINDTTLLEPKNDWTPYWHSSLCQTISLSSRAGLTYSIFQRSRALYMGNARQGCWGCFCNTSCCSRST
jgi:hypothetical protein